MSDQPIPRRIRIDLFTPAERAVYDAVQAVEALPADVRLTEAVVLLQQAREKIADFVDGVSPSADRGAVPANLRQDCDCTCCDHSEGSDCACECHATGKCSSGAVPAEPERTEPPQHVIDLAVESSLLSPCRSKRGVVIFGDGGGIVGTGYNYKPRGFDCDGSLACKSTCRAEAIHAEQQALLVAGVRAAGRDLLHVKTVDGVLVPSGPPSCVQCSKLALVAGIAGVWLFRGEDGWVRYPAAEFHRLSLAALGAGETPASAVESLTPAQLNRIHNDLRVQQDANRIIAAYVRTVADKIQSGQYLTDENEAEAEPSTPNPRGKG